MKNYHRWWLGETHITSYSIAFNRSWSKGLLVTSSRQGSLHRAIRDNWRQLGHWVSIFIANFLLPLAISNLLLSTIENNIENFLVSLFVFQRCCDRCVLCSTDQNNMGSSWNSRSKYVWPQIWRKCRSTHCNMSRAWNHLLLAWEEYVVYVRLIFRQRGICDLFTESIDVYPWGA